MSKDRSPWQDGRRAWERLRGWHHDGTPANPGHPDDGQSAVEALADIGLVRHLLDQAELVAVRTARKHGKSWAEIATQLGVTRQSAWERWRDLDDTAGPRTTETGFDRDTVLDAVAADASERQARAWRRRSSVVVPQVIGRTCDDARRALDQAGLVGVGSDPEGSPFAVVGWPDGVVTDQSPESGAKVPAGSPVTLWVDPGGGSAGVREPRRPKPSPRIAREMRPEPSEDAVG